MMGREIQVRIGFTLVLIVAFALYCRHEWGKPESRIYDIAFVLFIAELVFIWAAEW